MGAPLCSDEIIELAFDATSAAELRQELLARLVASTGAVGGVLADPSRPVLASEVFGLPVEVVERTRIPVWCSPPQVSGFGPLIESLKNQRAVADTGLFSPTERESLPIYRCHQMMGVDSAVCAWISPTPGRGSILCLGFGPGDPADSEIESYVGQLVPALTLAVEAFPMPRGAGDEMSFPSWLTERQREICVFVVHGYTNAEIAQACGISVNTVRNHLVKLFRELSVGTRTELASQLLFLSEQEAASQKTGHLSSAAAAALQGS